MNNKIIFLDFDGTLLPTLYEKFLKTFDQISKSNISSSDVYGLYFHPDCMNNLRILIQASIDPKIVLTTTWKNDTSLNNLINMWGERGYSGKIIGKTPHVDNSKRGLEIQKYLEENPCEKYVILDDMSESFFLEEQIPFLVKCDEQYGFGKKELSKALGILM